MKNFLLSLLDLIYKKKCYCCGESKHSLKLCPNCYNELSYSPFCPNRIINEVKIFTCGIYEKNLQKIIRGLKYHNQRELAYYLAKFLYEYFVELNLNQDFQVIAVPLHKNRTKKRGFNHMELVAEEFCKLAGLTSNFKLIHRIKDTKPQYKLTRAQRLENLANAFEVDKNADLNKPVLILDDICTTGATFEEIISTLKQTGISDITCLAISNP